MDKKEFRRFNIDIYGLSYRAHEYHFSSLESLFSLFEQDIVSSGSGECIMFLDKSETMITLNFDIQARVELTCDVTLKPFEHPINAQKQLMIKFGDEPSELSDDVIVIAWDTKTINVAEYIYQFMLLEIPLKRTHPDLEADRPDILYVSETEPEETEKDEIDPRWEALKKLK